MRIRRQLRCAVAVICMLVLSLTGCGKKGKLDEGDCACVVKLESIPQEFNMLGDNVRSLLEIEVILENITTERQYYFILNGENGFQQDATLYPGVYKVSFCTGDPNFLSMDISARQEQMDVKRDKVNELAVYIENMEAFSELARNSQPIQEVMQLDKFSHKVQWEGQIIDLEHITDYVEFQNNGYDGMVRGYGQVTLQNSGIAITLQNETSQQMPWTECKLIKVQVGNPGAVFAGGARVGMSVREAVHAEEGIYGTPDSMTGTVFIGMDLDETRMVYYNEASGDRLTLVCDLKGEYIRNIIYEFAAYE